MKSTILILSLLFCINSHSQKELKISENEPTQRFYSNLGQKLEKLNLKDLRNGNDKGIRIWKQNTILSLNDSASITFYTANGKETFSKTYTFKKAFNLDALPNVSALKFPENNEQQSGGIDEFPIALEISTSEEYQVVSGYGNTALKEFISKIYKKYDLKSLKDSFINQLPRGHYSMGMSGLSIDHFLDDAEEKSDFYKKLVQEVESELKMSKTTPAHEFPLILINGKTANFKTINSLDVAKIQSYKILPRTATTDAVYGESAENGIILVTTN